MITQVRMREVSTDASGVTSESDPVFVFGTHPAALDTDYPVGGRNTVATVPTTDNPMRIVIDELLVGNYLEEIACRAPVDNDAYSSVPLGATPEDVAKCAAAKSVLPSTCPSTMSHAMCICQIPGGCGDVAEGAPVGVLDVNEDGAADDTRLIAGSVGIQCGAYAVAIDQNASYWNPSGNQEPPAGVADPFGQIGPAIVLAADSREPYSGAFPSGQDCQLTFASNIVDKTDHKVCTPPQGDVTQNCTEGDTSLFTFKTQPFTIVNDTFDSGATSIARTAPVVFIATAPIDVATVAAGLTVTGPGATPVTNFTITEPEPNILRLVWGSGALAAGTMYTITITSALTDAYGVPVAPVTYTFTTA